MRPVFGDILISFGVRCSQLGDALDQVAELKGTVAARDAELEKVRGSAPRPAIVRRLAPVYSSV